MWHTRHALIKEGMGYKEVGMYQDLYEYKKQTKTMKQQKTTSIRDLQEWKPLYKENKDKASLSQSVHYIEFHCMYIPNGQVITSSGKDLLGRMHGQ